MEFTEEQVREFQNLFETIDLEHKGFLNEAELRQLLLEFEIDESFAPPLLRILSHNAEGVEFNDILNFFKVLNTGNIKDFFRLLFSAIDEDNDQTLGVQDITSFAELVGDNLSEDEVSEIMKQCDINNDGKVNFDDFWRWYKQQHGISNGDENLELSL